MYSVSITKPQDYFTIYYNFTLLLFIDITSFFFFCDYVSSFLTLTLWYHAREIIEYFVFQVRFYWPAKG